MDFDFIYIKRSAINFWIALRTYILHFFFTFIDFYNKIRVVSEHFSKTLGGPLNLGGISKSLGGIFQTLGGVSAYRLNRTILTLARENRL